MLAKIVRALVEAGCSPEQILAAVEVGEAEILARDDERKAKQRERTARHRQSRSVTLRDVTPPSPPISNDPQPLPAKVEFNLTSSPPHPPIVPPKAPRRGANASSEFDRFWVAFPRRDGANPKQPAAKSFHRAVAAGADPVAIIRGAERLADQHRGKDARFIPQAVTWLNQSRWADDALSGAAGATGPPDETMPEGLTVDQRNAWLRDWQQKRKGQGNDGGGVRAALGGGGQGDAQESGWHSGLFPDRSHA